MNNDIGPGKSCGLMQQIKRLLKEVFKQLLVTLMLDPLVLNHQQAQFSYGFLDLSCISGCLCLMGQTMSLT